MGGKILFTILGLIIAVQSKQDNEDSRIVSCFNKIRDQLKGIDLKEMSNCYDSKKLDGAKQHGNTLLDYLNNLPSQCRNPTKENLSYCMKEIGTVLTENKQDIITEIKTAIRALLGGWKNCYYEFISILQNFDVINECK